MKIFKKFIVAAIVILLLEGVKILMNEVSPVTRLFHQQFILVIQVAIAIWLPIIILLILFKQGESWFARFLPVLLVLMIIGMDMWMGYLLVRPEKIPETLRPAFRAYYNDFEKKDIRFEPCTVYDSTVGPRIIPGLRFAFGNIEYRNQYNMNRESFRENEEDLFGPPVICVGNTQTIGCGVENDETYSQQLELLTGKKVVNAGSIYSGTSEQLKELDRIDTSVLEFLVIQYSPREPDAAVFDFRRDTASDVIAQSFALNRKQYQWAKEYFPGKYAVSIMINWIRSFFQPEQMPLSRDEMNNRATQFLRKIAMLKGVPKYQIIIVSIDKFASPEPSFKTAIDSILNQQEFAGLKSQVRTVDLSGVLAQEDFYMLDDHLKVSGHKKIAEQLALKMAPKSE